MHFDRTATRQFLVYHTLCCFRELAQAQLCVEYAGQTNVNFVQTDSVGASLRFD
jgi:hypothetical protein